MQGGQVRTTLVRLSFQQHLLVYFVDDQHYNYNVNLSDFEHRFIVLYLELTKNLTYF